MHITRRRSLVQLLCCLVALSGILLSGCGVYSFSGASIEGKTINIHVFENQAQNINPSLIPTLTSKVRNRILSQTGLSPRNSDDVDYDMMGVIKTYATTVTGMQNTQIATQNRLTIDVEITFKNRLNEKASFKQVFSRFADYPATQSIQSVEGRLVEEIGNLLADDIFNKAFVNW